MPNDKNQKPKTTEEVTDTISCSRCDLYGWCVGGFEGTICTINPYGDAIIVD